jgi:hypothetical protein
MSRCVNALPRRSWFFFVLLALLLNELDAEGLRLFQPTPPKVPTLPFVLHLSSAYIDVSSSSIIIQQLGKNKSRKAPLSAFPFPLNASLLRVILPAQHISPVKEDYSLLFSLLHFRSSPPRSHIPHLQLASSLFLLFTNSVPRGNQPGPKQSLKLKPLQPSYAIMDRAITEQGLADIGKLFASSGYRPLS